jgi:alpha-L-fucosidase
MSRQLMASAGQPIDAPAKFGAIPSQRQLDWHEFEFYAFLHFTVNTFTGLEWGYGDEDPSVFCPTAFDPDAIVSDLKAGGVLPVWIGPRTGRGPIHKGRAPMGDE